MQIHTYIHTTMSFSHDYFASAMLGVILGNLVVYDVEKCVDCVQEKERMGEEELLTWMERNVTNSCSGSGIRCLSWTGIATCCVRLRNEEAVR